MSKIAGKVIWITGASSGIGEALTYELAKRGARLILSSRRKGELEKVKGKGIKALSIAEFKSLASDDAVILDTRKATEFTHGYVPGSISIGLEGRFAEWAGNLLPFDKKIILVTDPGQEEESVIRLTRVGFDKMEGYLAGGYEAWLAAGEKTDLIINVDPDELMMDIPHDPKMVILDVRRQTEYANGHLEDALNIPLDTMTDVVNIAGFEDTQNIYIHCASGYRSVIAASMLKKQGIHNLRNIVGGWDKIKLEKDVKIVKEASMLN